MLSCIEIYIYYTINNITTYFIQKYVSLYVYKGITRGIAVNGYAIFQFLAILGKYTNVIV